MLPVNKVFLQVACMGRADWAACSQLCFTEPEPLPAPLPCFHPLPALLSLCLPPVQAKGLDPLGDSFMGVEDSGTKGGRGAAARFDSFDSLEPSQLEVKPREWGPPFVVTAAGVV